MVVTCFHEFSNAHKCLHMLPFFPRVWVDSSPQNLANETLPTHMPALTEVSRVRCLNLSARSRRSVLAHGLSWPAFRRSIWQLPGSVVTPSCGHVTVCIKSASGKYGNTSVQSRTTVYQCTFIHTVVKELISLGIVLTEVIARCRIDLSWKLISRIMLPKAANIPVTSTERTLGLPLVPGSLQSKLHFVSTTP